MLTFAHLFKTIVTEISEEQWVDWIDRLSVLDYLVIDDFISEDTFLKLRAYYQQLLDEQDFDKAGIGTLQHYTVNKSIRGDEVFWLDKPRDQDIIPDFYDIIDQLKYYLNRYCFLSIADYEFHMAHYPVGTFYKRHLDQFNERSNRLITLILYLNEGWQEKDGGELVIYTPDSPIKVEPLGKRLVVFKSDMLEHEVLPTNKGRYSITGWYLRQPVGLGFL